MTDSEKAALMAKIGRDLYENLITECQNQEHLDEPDQKLVASIAAGYIMAHSTTCFPLENIDGYLEHWFEGVKITIEDMRPDFKAKRQGKRESKKYKDDVITTRVTNRGAISAVLMDINTLTYLHTILIHNNIEKVSDLIQHIKKLLNGHLTWLNRVPDGTLNDMTKEEIHQIKKDAEWALNLEITSNTLLKNRKRGIDSFNEIQQSKKESFSIEEKDEVLLDTSFLLAMIFKNEQCKSAKLITNYLRSNTEFCLIRVPNLVNLELISKIMQKHPFKKAVKMFEDFMDGGRWRTIFDRRKWS